MGKEKSKAKKKKHRSRKSKEEPSSRNSDSELDDVEIEQLQPIGTFVKDRYRMIDEMFAALKHGNHLKSIMPDVLKPLPLDELKRMCVEELEGMSKKRIRYILAGEEMTSSSGTDESSSEHEEDDGELENTAPASAAAPIVVSSPVGRIAEEPNSSTTYQQPDSTCEELVAPIEETTPSSPQPSSAKEATPNSINGGNLEDDEFVEIILGDSSPSPAPIDSPAVEQPDVISNADGQQDGGRNVEEPTTEKESKIDDPPMQSKSGEPTIDLESSNSSGETDDEEESSSDDGSSDSEEASSEEAAPADDGRAPSAKNESDLEDGEISESPMRSIRKKAPVITTTTNEAPSQADDNSDDDGCADLMAEIQAQDALQFGELVAQSSSAQNTDKKFDEEEDGPLEFVDVPPETEANATVDFAWNQQPIKSKTTTSEEGPPVSEGAAAEVREEETEPYDDGEECSRDAVSSSGVLLPPGFEQPSTSTSTQHQSPATQELLAAESTPVLDNAKSTTSVLPIRTLYRQLKQHRQATEAIAKKGRSSTTKPSRVYGPSPWTKSTAGQAANERPNGPALPPPSDSNEAAATASSSSSTINKEKPKKQSSKKKSSSAVLTPEFLAELERKRTEHEREMKEKMELLVTIKAKRQKVTDREKEMEGEMKRKLELGLFESTAAIDQKSKSTKATRTNIVGKRPRIVDDTPGPSKSNDDLRIDDEDGASAIVDPSSASTIDDDFVIVDSGRPELRDVDMDLQQNDDLLLIADEEEEDLGELDDRRESRSRSITSHQPNVIAEKMSTAMKFPPIVVSISASSGGKLIRKVETVDRPTDGSFGKEQQRSMGNTVEKELSGKPKERSEERSVGRSMSRKSEDEDGYGRRNLRSRSRSRERYNRNDYDEQSQNRRDDYRRATIHDRSRSPTRTYYFDRQDYRQNYQYPRNRADNDDRWNERRRSRSPDRSQRRSRSPDRFRPRSRSPDYDRDRTSGHYERRSRSPDIDRRRSRSPDRRRGDRSPSSDIDRDRSRSSNRNRHRSHHRSLYIDRSEKVQHHRDFNYGHRRHRSSDRSSDRSPAVSTSRPSNSTSVRAPSKSISTGQRTSLPSPPHRSTRASNVPPPKLQPPEEDENFQRQTELLELELRAKAIRSLMKNETKEDVAAAE